MNSANKKPEWLKITTDYFFESLFLSNKTKTQSIKTHYQERF